MCLFCFVFIEESATSHNVVNVPKVHHHSLSTSEKDQTPLIFQPMYNLKTRLFTGTVELEQTVLYYV